MSHPLFRAIMQLEEHGIRDMQPRQLVQGAGRHDDLAAVIHILSFRARHHRDGVASIVFIETASERSISEERSTQDSFHWVVVKLRREL